MKKSFLIYFFLAVVSFLSAFTLEEHNSSRSYPEKSFVIFNGDSYRAVKAVPANTLITNSEFWSNLKTEASQQTLPSGSETPPSTQTDDIVKTLPGGGDGNGSTPPISPPEFSNPPSTLNFVENSVETVHTAFAVGADSYTISGNDASLFTIIEGTGVIKFINSPDYENPTDNNGDNNYSLNIKAENSLGYDEHLLSILVTDDTSDNPPIPVFSTANTVSFKENGLGPVYTANATGSPVYSISGDDEPLFTINSATGVLTFNASPDYESPSDQGSDNAYSVTVKATNDVGSTDLSLTVNVTDDTSDNDTKAKLINISTRGYVGTGNDILIAGFKLEGDETATKKCMIGVTAASREDNEEAGFFTLKDPLLILYKEGVEDYLAINFSWTSLSDEEKAIIDDSAPSSDKDPVIVADLGPGTYTAIVMGNQGLTGIATVGVNDLKMDGGTGKIELVNISTRGYVKSEPANWMFAGFIVEGSPNSSIDVMIGNTAASLGDNPEINFYALKDPLMLLYKDGVDGELDRNDNWEDRSDSEKETMNSIKATPKDSKESAIVKTLSPGTYNTVMLGLSGVGNAVIGVNVVP